jgi:peptide/nickel transport system permease protein
VVFVMMRILPGDAMAFAVENPAQLEALRRDLGLDRPVYVQYGIWFWHMLHGDMGRSIQLRKPVLDVLLPQFVNTLILAAGSFVLAIVVGWSVGIVSATRQYSLADRLTMLVTLFGVSMPAFWLGLVLMWLFAYKLRWLPAAGMYSIRGEKRSGSC